MYLRENHSRAWLLKAAVVLVVSLSVSAQQEDNETRIVGGFATTIEAIPYIVQIQRDDEFICGGSIIANIWVLSAAHCVVGYGPNRFKVRGGTSFISGSEGVTREVEKIIIPSNYNPTTHHMDASMFKLKSSILGANRQVIPLIKNVVPNGQLVQVSGWGALSENGNYPNQLRSVRVPKIAIATCRSDYQGTGNPITNSMMCASTAGKKDSCQGDSGGPLVYQGKLAGIVSFGEGCARPEFPGVYTNILSVTNFIEQVMSVHS